MAKYDLKISSAGDGDFAQSTNILNAFKRAKFELTGEEVLGLAESLKWFIMNIHAQIDNTLRPKPAETPEQKVETALATAKPKRTKLPTDGSNK
jgi:hypothetical protein